MVSDISILIPVFNQDVTALTHTLLAQCRRLAVNFEIRLYDDGSTDQFKVLNRPLGSLENVIYEEMPENLGRAAIRNKLAQDAAYGYLLFLDNDCIPVSSNFILRYLRSAADAEIVVGGVAYVTKAPEKDYLLHWKYGKSRGARPVFKRRIKPYQDIFLCNALVSKDLMLRFPLKESLRKYGHEDTLFACYLKRNKIEVTHIHNPVVHLGLEEAPILLEKTAQAVINLAILYNEGELKNELKIIQAFEILKTMRLQKTFISFLGRLEVLLHFNLKSSSPNLYIYDLYRLYLFSKLLNQEQKQS